MSDGRRDELAASLTALRARIDAAAQAAGRDPAGLVLVAVTKTHPASDVAHLAALGVADVGESRDQEARPKRAESPPGLRWHMLGRLQSNKAASVARWADVVHSVDRDSLVAPLARGAEGRPDPLAVLLQVSLDDDPARGGCRPEELSRLADGVAAHPSLRLAGVMAVAPQGADPDAAFARLEACAAGLREAHPGADWLSAGMSGDLEAAVRHGATHLRVGTALLGGRGAPGR